jgi:hypothetical protein
MKLHYDPSRGNISGRLIIPVLILLLSFLNGCKEKKNDEPSPDASGKIKFTFQHYADGNPGDFDTLKYMNAAGNQYMITDIQYFISDVILYNHNGTNMIVDDPKEIDYIDTGLPDTWTWEIYNKIPSGRYDSISFTFGICEEKNISYSLVNPPESYMYWPEFLGGGYHYLKLNGSWLEPGQTSVTTPFNIHLGMGQVYYSYPDSITGFIPNDFRVSLPGSAFNLSPGQTKNIILRMNVEEWFKDPHIYDFNVWGGYTMQNQDAMQELKENGYNVFSIIIE